MDIPIWMAIAAIALLLVLSAFFSGSETALTAASSARMHHLARDGNRRARLVNRLREDKDILIGTLLLGNNLVNILASALATGVLLRLAGDVGIAYATLGMTLLVLIFSEVLPKTYAINHADRMALGVAPPVRLLVLVSRPVTALIRLLVAAILRLFGQSAATAPGAGIEELRGVIELQQIPYEQRAMLRSILDLTDLEVQDIMVPRGRIMSIDVDLPTAEIVDRMLASPYTRVPLWQQESDNIVGILHAKVLFRELRRTGGRVEGLNLRAIATPAVMIAPSTRLFDQLRAFRENQAHQALIVDEYGGIAGLVTLEDILEEIVGEIHDEDERPQSGMLVEDGGAVLVEGWVAIRDLNRRMDWRLPDEEASTISGLVMSEAQTIPPEGGSLLIAGHRVDVVKRAEHMIAELRIWPAVDDDDGGGF